MSKVWYVGYGSNLSKQRFHCYIEGGIPCFGRIQNKEGCLDKTLPIANKPIEIPYPLYFALPDDKKNTGNWGDGGVAFIDSTQKNSITYCRMWKITSDQYNCVKTQEGRYWYSHQIELGKDNDDGLPIFTITNKDKLSNILRPSDNYLKTIAVGLKETYEFSNEEITEYLISKEGMKDIHKNELRKILSTIACC
jgi:hypothetical protein